MDTAPAMTQPLEPIIPFYGRERPMHRPSCATRPWKSGKAGICDCGAAEAAAKGECNHGKKFSDECGICNRKMAEEGSGS